MAGSAQDVAEVREWRRRLGGTLHGLWPAAASALNLLPERLAEMPARLAHARAIAAAVADLPGIEVLPDPPQTPMLHLLFSSSAERFAANLAGWPSSTASGSGRRRCRPATRRWSAAS